MEGEEKDGEISHLDKVIFKCEDTGLDDGWIFG